MLRPLQSPVPPRLTVRSSGYRDAANVCLACVLLGSLYSRTSPPDEKRARVTAERRDACQRTLFGPTDRGLASAILAAPLSPRHSGQECVGVHCTALLNLGRACSAWCRRRHRSPPPRIPPRRASKDGTAFTPERTGLCSTAQHALVAGRCRTHLPRVPPPGRCTQSRTAHRPRRISPGSDHRPAVPKLQCPNAVFALGVSGLDSTTCRFVVVLADLLLRLWPRHGLLPPRLLVNPGPA